MLLTVIFALIFAFATTSVVADSSCSSYCTGCNSLSVGASSYQAPGYTCNGATTPLITSVTVTDADSDGDGFKVTLMDQTNYDKYRKGQLYSYFDISGTGPDHSYTCFRSGDIEHSAPAGYLYLVIYCTNILETCHLRYEVDVTCRSACAGVNCNNGHCSSGRCICNSGYSGTYCDQNDCSSNCDNGHCDLDTCVCYSGYSGIYCNYYTYNPFSSDPGKPLVIGLICGGVALLIIIVVVVVVVVLYRRRRRRSGDIELVNEVTPQ